METHVIPEDRVQKIEAAVESLKAGETFVSRLQVIEQKVDQALADLARIEDQLLVIIQAVVEPGPATSLKVDLGSPQKS
jgi:cob(I)alamin adenosyltransferase